MSADGTSAIYVFFPHKRRGAAEADFAAVTRQLRSAGLQASYDAIEVDAGEALWDRVAPWVTCGDIAGCAYILTRGNTSGPVCAGLVSALERAYTERGAAFPLVGLLHGVAPQNLPLPVRLRPWIHLADPAWREQLKRAFSPRAAVEETSEFVWTVHRSYGGDPAKTAVEVSPRGDVVRCWRFAVPATVPPFQWGHGSAGGGAISPLKFSALRGAGRLKDIDVTWFGSEDALSPSESAYLVFHGRLPDFVCFGRARNPSSPPGKMEMFRGLTTINHANN